MRLRGLLALLLALFFVPVPAMGEEVNASIVEDDSGDVVVMTPDGQTSQPDPTGQFEDVDLVSMGIWAEDPESVTFFVEVASLTESSQRPTPFGDPDYKVFFQYGGQGYRVQVFTVLSNPANNAFGREAGAFAWLEQQVDEGQYRRVADGEAELDFSGDRVLATIPRAAIVDENQAPLGLNATLTGFYAVAESMGWFAFPIGGFQGGGDPITYAGAPKAHDTAPDGGLTADLPAYRMTTGDVKQKGSLVATSQDPIRWTNGEASTLTFTAQVTNTASEDIPVAVSTAGTQPTWEVAYSDRLTVPAHATVNVTFLVTIPFTHSHGNLHMFEAVFESPDEEHFAASDLGVYWPSVPQPAGHHDRIWFHSNQPENENSFPVFSEFDDGIHAWMSAAEDEEADEALPVPSDFVIPPSPFTDTEAIAFWQIALEPPLRMGMDFRPEDLGSAEITIDFPATVVDPFMEFTLYHRVDGGQGGGPGGGQGGGPSRQTELASGVSEPVSGTTSGTQTFAFELDVPDDADDLPYTPDGNLVASIVVRATFMAGGGFFNPDEIAPKLLPDGSGLQLPLDEYADPVDLSFQTDGSLSLAPGEEGQQRLVNPGRTVVYTFALQYEGSEPSGFTTSLTGQNAAWAEVVGDTAFSLEPGATRTLGLAVTAPRDASDGERADLTLTVIDADNAAVQAGINTVTMVDSTEDIPDEASRKDDLHGELSTSKESPAPSMALLAGILAAVALLGRRR